MKTITIASAKGGSCKSTCVATLAARAAKDSGRVAMLDLNEDQGNLTDWWTLRGRPKNPRLVDDLEDITEDIETLKRAGCEWVFIDTPPLEIRLIEQAIAIADAVVIPVRPSFLDINATNAVTSLCRRHRKPFAFLLAAVDTKMPKLTEQATHMLLKIARPGGAVMASRMSYRQAYIQAMAVGRTAQEISKELAAEIDNIWAEVQQLAEPKRVSEAAQ
jgi:chromosome partitioning protein